MNQNNNTGTKPLGNPRERFLTYLRTLQVVRQRLGGIDDADFVHVPQKTIEREFFKYPASRWRAELARLEGSGDLVWKWGEGHTPGRKYGLFKAIKPGDVDLSLLKPNGQEWGANGRKMASYLLRVSIPEECIRTEYLRLFIQNRETYLPVFFTVDGFSGRVHTPITSMPAADRMQLLIDGCPVVSMDVSQMQPRLLGLILNKHIAQNDISTFLDEGGDIYTMIQERANLATREDAKKRFYQIVFGYPSTEINQYLNDWEACHYINRLKEWNCPENPHRERRHTNLAYMLQRDEVRLMRRVWERLCRADIPFLSVHDEILCRESDAPRAEKYFRTELNSMFHNYKLNIKKTTY